MADKTTGGLPAVEEAAIGSLPGIADLYDDTLLPVEQQGEAMHMTGRQWKKYAQASVEGYVDGAEEAARAAAASAAAAAAYIVIYLGKSFFYNGLLVKGLDPAGAWVATLGKLPSSLFNGIVAVIFAPILGVALHKALKAANLEIKPA